MARRAGTLNLNEAAGLEIAKEVYMIDLTGTGAVAHTDLLDISTYIPVTAPEPEPPQMPKPTMTRRREAFIKAGQIQDISSSPRSRSPMRKTRFNTTVTTYTNNSDSNTRTSSRGRGGQEELVTTTDVAGLALKKQIVRPTLKNLRRNGT